MMLLMCGAMVGIISCRNVVSMCASVDGVDSLGSMSLVSLIFLWK